MFLDVCGLYVKITYLARILSSGCKSGAELRGPDGVVVVLVAQIEADLGHSNFSQGTRNVSICFRKTN
jgi:hypothetical protein